MSSFQGRQRRLDRRRLAAAGGSVAAEEPPAETASPTKRAGRLYAHKALPEHQPSPATRIPVGGLTLAGAVLGLLLVPALLTGLAMSEQQWLPFADAVAASGWAGTLGMARELADLANPAGIAAVVGQWCFLLAAAVAVAVRHMRRHRLDDYQGRYRAWGWLSVVFTMAAATFILPIDRVVTTVATEASGWQAGPDGRGWWVGLIALLCVPLGLWAVLPLTQRLGGLWLALSLGGWIAAEAIDWRLADEPVWRLAAAGLRAFIGPLAAIGTLHAARGVIREARGLVTAKPAEARTRETAAGSGRKGQGRRSEAATAESERFVDDAVEAADRAYVDDVAEQDTGALQLHANGDPVTRGGDEDEDADDPSDGEVASDDGRHLSKAERRRLRKLARRNRAA